VDLDAPLPEEAVDVAEEDEQLFVLGAPEPVEHDGGPAPHAFRGVFEQRVHEEFRDAAGRQQFRRPNARLAVDAHPDLHLAGLDGEQGLGLAWQGAAGEGYADAAGDGVGLLGRLLDAVHVVAARGGGARHLEDVEVAGHAAPLLFAALRRGGHVVGDDHGADVHAFVAAARLGHVEVHHVARVVAVGEEHARAAVQRLRAAVDLLRGGAREDVPDHGPVREALADRPAERRIVPGAAPDQDRDLTPPGRPNGHNPRGVRHAPHVAPVSGQEPLDHLVLERPRVVRQYPFHVAPFFSSSPVSMWFPCPSPFTASRPP
jgi:hypothetical protein